MDVVDSVIDYLYSKIRKLKAVFIFCGDYCAEYLVVLYIVHLENPKLFHCSMLSTAI